MADNKKQDGYIYYVHREKGFVSEFFDHMLAYGGFNVQDGMMTVWGDPSLFTPVRAFTRIYDTLKQTTPDADQVMYWLGRLYGKNSTLILMKKFGFDKKKLPDFVNGATQDGFGYMTIRKMRYNDKHLDLQMTGEQSALAIAYAKLRGKQKNVVDHYMCGILSGGAEPLFDDQSIECHEIKCMAQGAKRCEYQMNTIPHEPEFPFFRKMPFKDADVRAKTKSIALRRKLNFSLFQRKNIKFGDGLFVLNGHQGFNMSVYEHILLDKILLAYLGEKKYGVLKDEIAKIIVEDIEDKQIVGAPLTGQTMIHMLSAIMPVGFGKLSVATMSGTHCIIINENNPYMIDSHEIFGGINPLAVDLPTRMLAAAYKHYFKKEASVEILKVGLQQSSFKISFGAQAPSQKRSKSR